MTAGPRGPAAAAQRRPRRAPLTLLLLGLALQGCAPAGHRTPLGAQPGPAQAVAAAVRAQAVVELPIEIHHGHVLVAGQVNGQPGRFMLDNGTPFGFFLNRNQVALAVGPELARGHAGSGQPVVVHAALDVASLHLAGHAELPGPAGGPDLAPHAADFGFLQTIIPDFLGFVGAPWLARQLFALRYAPARLLLADADRGAAALQQGSERVALIRFEGRDGVLPHARLQLGDTDLRGLFDTGNPGTLQLTADTRARLERSGALRCENGPPVRCRPLDLRHGTQRLASSPMPLTLGADNRVVLGTAVLQHHVSVWDLRAGTLDLRRDLQHPPQR